MDIKINPDDSRYIFITGGNSHEIGLLKKHYNLIPQYQLLPSYRGIPRPVVHLNQIGHGVFFIHSGLWRDFQVFCANNGILVNNEIPKTLYRTETNIDLEGFIHLVEGWFKDSTIKPRKYQVRAAWKMIHYRMSLSVLATRAGKTLISAMVYRWLMEYRGIKKILMIVPSIQLVKQGAEDYRSYMSFFGEHQPGEVWAGNDLMSTNDFVIGTFQSLVLRLDPRSGHYNPGYFDGVDCVMVDEVHRAKSVSIQKILSAPFMKGVKIKMGMTGTLPKKGSIEDLDIQSLLGPVIQEINPEELVEGGFLARPVITQYRIKYTPEEIEEDTIRCGEYLNSIYKTKDGKKVPLENKDFTIQYEKTLPTAIRAIKQSESKKEYIKYLINLCAQKGANVLALEQMLVHRSTKRLGVIKTIIQGQGAHNGIIFTQHIEYQRFLVKCLKKWFPNKSIYTINGGVSLKKRLDIIEKMNEDNCILVGSYAVIGTGITFKNVDYGIFAQSFKSDIVNRQSMGRLMLRSASKETFPLYDIIDVFPTKRLYNQGLAKIRTYKNDGWEYKIVNM